jgi:hypothetical protein
MDGPSSSEPSSESSFSLSLEFELLEDDELDEELLLDEEELDEDESSAALLSSAVFVPPTAKDDVGVSGNLGRLSMRSREINFLLDTVGVVKSDGERRVFPFSSWLMERLKERESFLAAETTPSVVLREPRLGRGTSLIFDWSNLLFRLIARRFSDSSFAAALRS